MPFFLHPLSSAPHTHFSSSQVSLVHVHLFPDYQRDLVSVSNFKCYCKCAERAQAYTAKAPQYRFENNDKDME